MDTFFSIEGNVTRDPETRLVGGSSKTAFGIAVNKRWTDQTSHEKREKTSFFDIECWRDLAENVADTVTKGMRVVVTGNIEQQSWETESGDKRSKVVFVAQSVAPSLRWATANVSKNPQNGTAAKTPASVAASGGDEFGDEEPF